ncbi:MAG: transposase [Nitrospinota bacterium]
MGKLDGWPIGSRRGVPWNAPAFFKPNGEMPKGEFAPMPPNPDRQRRSSLRLKGYDYSRAGAYFVTFCTLNRELFFLDEGTRGIAEQCWREIPVHFPSVQLDEWVVMPNHLHGILVLDLRRGVQLNAPTKNLRGNPFSAISPRPFTLSVAVRTYKAAVTTRSRRSDSVTFGWQRNYYEHIIRNEQELNRIRQYIAENPLGWASDPNNPSATEAKPAHPWENPDTPWGRSMERPCKKQTCQSVRGHLPPRPPTSPPPTSSSPPRPPTAPTSR